VSTKRLLSVDDDPDTLKQRKLLLENSGYQVESAGSGQEALDLLAGGVLPDVILLDYTMPGMNGDELASRIRQQYPRLPLIAVSAIHPLPAPLAALINASVLKGEEPQVLLARVAAVLQSEDEGHTRESGAKRTILCVEDEELQLKARKMLFESVGYHVLAARSVKGAMEAFTSNPVDAVVMDYWLSDQDGNGTAVAEQMKRLRPLIPIVMLSGFTALPGEGALVDSWVRKAQMEPEKLVAEVDRLIKLRSLRRETTKPQ
jgi:CheY-like chemotaxis protein